MARFVRRHRARPSPASELHPEADPFEPPPPYEGDGRPPVRGPRRPEPRPAAAGATLKTEEVAWYGGGRREVGVTAGAGHWYKAGEGLVPIAWVFAKDRSGPHRDEYLFSTDPALAAVTRIEAYAGRRDPETTFQEARCFLGLGGTRGWCRRTAPRAAPCLSGLYTAVALRYRGLPASERSGRVGWPGKAGVTFCDAPTCVRRWLWREWAFARAGGGVAIEQLPEPLHRALSYALAPAA